MIQKQKAGGRRVRWPDERLKIQHRLVERQNAEEPARGETVLDTIQLSLNQITEYYTINKGQARNSFRFSMFAIVAGLVTLIGGIWIFYFGQTPDTRLTIVSGVAGVLVEFIGAAYFYLYNRSLIQLNFFYDKLVKMQYTMLAVRLCDSLPDDRRTKMKEKLIGRLMERSSAAESVSPQTRPDASQLGAADWVHAT